MGIAVLQTDDITFPQLLVLRLKEFLESLQKEVL